jgi:hypothetical protein
MQGNDTNIIVVTDKMRRFGGEIGLMSQKTGTKWFLHVFTFEEFCRGKECGKK